MADMKHIHEFAVKWYDKFRDKKINYIELIDHYMADDCEALGFVMDCGHAFSEKYGKAANDFEALERIISEITDIPLLGSAIYSQWRYFNHWAYSGEEILEPQNRAWFTIALSRLGELADFQLKRFKGTPQKVRIVSNNICYGPAPEPDDEVEQHITINTDGRVWFSAYNFGSGFDGHEKSRSKIYKIEKDTAARVLNSIAQYFSTEYIEVFATDIGEWEMEITNTDGEVHKYRGSLIADFEVDGVDLSDMVREALEMDDLYVFDGNNKPDRVDRITIDYHRITKIKPRQPISETVEYVTWDYVERLVLDRKSETLEHIQNIGSGCVVSRKYYVQGGIEGLLDDIDADDLFRLKQRITPSRWTSKRVRSVLSREHTIRRLCQSSGAILPTLYGSLCVFTEWAKYSILRSMRRSSAAEPITSTVAWNLTRATKVITTLPMRTTFPLAII